MYYYCKIKGKLNPLWQECCDCGDKDLCTYADVHPGRLKCAIKFWGVAALIFVVFVLLIAGCEQGVPVGPETSATETDNIPSPYNLYKFSFIVESSRGTSIVPGDSARYYWNEDLRSWCIDVYQHNCKGSGCGETIILNTVEEIRIK